MGNGLPNKTIAEKVWNYEARTGTARILQAPGSRRETLVDSWCDRRRAAHGDARHHDREHCLAFGATGSGILGTRPAVDYHGLRFDVRMSATHRRSGT